MFTGIIEAIGKVREPEKLGDGVRLTIDTPAGWLKGTEIGESIAVNGACMTGYLGRSQFGKSAPCW